MSRGQGRRLVLSCVGLAALSLLLHGRTLGFDFVDFDDRTVLLGHPNLYDETSLAASAREIFVGYFPREEPLLLRDLSWALDARLFGFENPFGYHLGNVVLNALDVCLLFLFLQRATRRLDFALVVALLFAALPVHVEPVSWIMGRKDLLAAFFVLSALLAQSVELESRSARRRRVFYGAGLAFTAMALLSKMGAIACVVVMALHRVFRRDLDGTRPAGAPFDLRAAVRACVPLLPHAVLTACIALWYSGVVRVYGVTGWRGPGPTDPEHLWNVVRFMPLVVGRYVQQIFFPSPPSVYYRWPHVEIPLAPLETATAIVIAAAGLAAVVWACVRRRDLAFYLLAFAAFLAPYSNVVYVGIWSADRYVYLSSFCLLAVVVRLAGDLAERGGAALRVTIGAGLAAFGLGAALYTLQHQGVWRDTEHLWRYEAHRDEPSLLSIQALAKLYMKRAEREEDPARRSELIAASRHEIARGFARERALGRVSAPYATSEQLQLARLHYLLGRLARIEGEPLTTQLEHFHASHAIAPSPSNTLLLAGSYYDLANGREPRERERYLRRSLDYFLEYAGFQASDPLVRERNLVLLAQNYEEPFPFLRDRIAKVRESMTP